jgi:hypothetical protein
MPLRFFIPIGMNDTDSEPQSAPADATSRGPVLGARSAPLPTLPPPVARPFGLLAWLLAAVGFAVGLAWERYRLPNAEDVKRFVSTENYDIWATLIALQPALWGALAPGLWRTWWRLFTWWRPKPKKRPLLRWARLIPLVVGFVVFVGLIESVLIVTRQGISIPETFATRNRWLLVPVAVIIVLPLTTGTWMVQGILGRLAKALPTDRHGQRQKLHWTSIGQEIFVQLQELRSVLQNLLFTGAVTIGAATLVTGAFRQAILAWNPKADFPPSYPLLYGGLFTVALAFLYLPVYLNLQQQGRALIEACWPIPDKADSIDDWHKHRQTAETTLGIAGGIKEGFQAGAAILTPLITAVVAVLLPNLKG